MLRRCAMTVLAVAVVTAMIRPSIPVHAQTSKSATEQPAALKLKVGDTAPDFTLRDQNGKEVSLKDFQGKKSVVLAFYIFAFTGG